MSNEPSTSAARHGVQVWRDDFGEWVWRCTCSPDLHGGYSSAGSATREAAVHRQEAHDAE